MAARVLTSGRLLVVVALASASCWLVASFDGLGGVDAAADAAMDVVSESTEGCDAGPSDPNNCGVCGRSCFGGACDGGICQPIVLADNQQLPVAIAVDDTFVYWSDYRGPDSGGIGQIWAATKDGLGTPFVVRSAEPSPGPLLPVGNSLYWLDQGSVVDGGEQSVWVSSLDGGDASLFAATPEPVRLAYDGTFIYWADFKTGIWRKPVGFGTACAMVYHPTAAGVAVDPSTQQVFWSAEGDDAGDIGGIFETSAALCSNLDAATPLVARPNGLPFELALDDASAYWSEISNANGDAINAVTRDGGTVTALFAGSSSRYEIAVSNGWIFWAGGTPNTVPSAGVYGERTDGTGRIHYASGDVTQAIAVDSCCIYWTDDGPDSGTGKIYKIAR
jgi:hypothetical protein